MSQPTSSNTSLLIIAVAIIAIVAMICGMVVWIMQRTLSLNEKYIDMRLAETRGTIQTPSQEKASLTVQARAPQGRNTPQAGVAVAQSRSEEPTRVEKSATPRAVAHAEQTVKAPTAVRKRKAPIEVPAAKATVGVDGLPLDRITLPTGKEDFDWQL